MEYAVRYNPSEILFLICIKPNGIADTDYAFVCLIIDVSAVEASFLNCELQFLRFVAVKV